LVFVRRIAHRDFVALARHPFEAHGGNMKMQVWHHWVLAIVIGYLVGYYFRGLGDATVAKIVPPGLSGRAA
jgi:hypothetical protein